MDLSITEAPQMQALMLVRETVVNSEEGSSLMQNIGDKESTSSSSSEVRKLSFSFFATSSPGCETFGLGELDLAYA